MGPSTRATRPLEPKSCPKLRGAISEACTVEVGTLSYITMQKFVYASQLVQVVWYLASQSSRESQVRLARTPAKPLLGGDPDRL